MVNQWGTEMPVSPLTQLRERMECKTDKNGPIVRPELGPCWLWTGAISSTGYGSVTFRKKGYTAHVLIYLLTHGHFPLPPLEVRHRCDIRNCVNPDHLLEGTREQNIQDCVERGRHGSITHPESYPRGDRHHHGMKTHCPRGHEYTPDNIYLVNNGASRACRKCALIRAKEHKAKKRAGL